LPPIPDFVKKQTAGMHKWSCLHLLLYNF
jgi:hypothetical protein